MFIILGILIALVTFPGVIVHELAHQIACRMMKVPVFKVCYFRFESPNGYVIHENTNDFWKTFVISIGPFILNTVLGVAFFIAGKFSVQEGLLELFLMWMGISIIMHAFPSKVDLDHVAEGLKINKFLVKMILYPIIGIMYIGTVGKIVWLDFIYSMGMVYLVERLILL